MTVNAARVSVGRSAGRRVSRAEVLTTAAALLAWSVAAATLTGLDVMAALGPGETPATAERSGEPSAGRLSEWRLGGYGGVSYTHPSVVAIRNPPATDMTVEGFSWIGRPFKAPIYYGARLQRLTAGMGPGAMLDFTHAKAIAKDDDVARFTGIRDGKPLPPSARVEEVFRHLEFSHGHNMVTLNGLWRMPALLGRIRPYAGAGAGISLPHTEVGFAGEQARTYEYQFAGFVGQGLAGIEVSLGRASVFVEYKFSYAPYSVPLSHEPYGWLLVTDLWRQFRAWATGEKPPGGVLDTVLASHHGIAGVMVRLGPPS